MPAARTGAASFGSRPGGGSLSSSRATPGDPSAGVSCDRSWGRLLKPRLPSARVAQPEAESPRPPAPGGHRAPQSRKLRTGGIGVRSGAPARTRFSTAVSAEGLAARQRTCWALSSLQPHLLAPHLLSTTLPRAQVLWRTSALPVTASGAQSTAAGRRYRFAAGFCAATAGSRQGQAPDHGSAAPGPASLTEAAPPHGRPGPRRSGAGKGGNTVGIGPG